VTDALADLLYSHRRIALDTSIFIYHLEDHPRYAKLAAQVFTWLERPGCAAATSTITMTELLVQPYRSFERRRVNAIRALLTTFPNLEWITPDLATADLAAQIRSEYRLQVSDALQAATAFGWGASLFLTNDHVFRRIKTLAALFLDDLL
jgi:predicted nucleic acid-binding protein